MQTLCPRQERPCFCYERSHRPSHSVPRNTACSLVIEDSNGSVAKHAAIIGCCLRNFEVRHVTRMGQGTWQDRSARTATEILDQEKAANHKLTHIVITRDKQNHQVTRVDRFAPECWSSISCMSFCAVSLVRCRRAREKGRISDPPTVSRTALSATSFTVISVFWRLKGYFPGSWMRQWTTTLTSMIF